MAQLQAAQRHIVSVASKSNNNNLVVNPYGKSNTVSSKISDSTEVDGNQIVVSKINSVKRFQWDPNEEEDEIPQQPFPNVYTTQNHSILHNTNNICTSSGSSVSYSGLHVGNYNPSCMVDVSGGMNGSIGPFIGQFGRPFHNNQENIPFSIPSRNNSNNNSNNMNISSTETRVMNNTNRIRLLCSKHIPLDCRIQGSVSRGFIPGQCFGPGRVCKIVKEPPAPVTTPPIINSIPHCHESLLVGYADMANGGELVRMGGGGLVVETMRTIYRIFKVSRYVSGSLLVCYCLAWCSLLIFFYLFSVLTILPNAVFIIT